MHCPAQCSQRRRRRCPRRRQGRVLRDACLSAIIDVLGTSCSPAYLISFLRQPLFALLRDDDDDDGNSNTMSSPPQMPTAVHYGADDRHAPQPQPAPAPPDQTDGHSRALSAGTTPRTSSSPPPQNALPNPYSLDGPPPRECLHLQRASESFRSHCVLCVTLCRRARRRVVDVSSVIFALRTDLCYLRTIPESEPDVSPKYQ